MQFTIRERRALPLARRAALVLGIGIMLGFAAPFSGYPPLHATVRYPLWICLVFAGYAAALAAEKLLPDPYFARAGLRLAIVSLVSAVPLTFVAAWMISLVRPGHGYAPLQLPVLFAATAVVQLAIVFTLLRTSGVPPLPTPKPREPPQVTFPSALLSRLPKRLGEEIVALEAEDHYVRVHTTLGSDLVLMRLSDAIAAIGPQLGLQVHRSWWVAHDAIRETVRSEHRSQLKLRNGLLVPVGRKYAAALRSRVACLRWGE